MTNMEEVEAVYRDVNAFADAYFDEVPRVAQQVFRERGVSEPDDIAQAIWETVVRDFDKAFSGEDRDTVTRRFRVIARQYVSRESVDAMYFQGNYIYSPEDVRAILEELRLPGDDEFGQIDGELDVHKALNKLPLRRSQAVRKRYFDGVQPKDMSKSERNALYRGIDSITHHLNRQAGVRSARLDAMHEEPSGGNRE